MKIKLLNRLRNTLLLIFKPFKNTSMSRPQKILVDFNKFTNPVLTDKAQTVINALTGSSVIPTPTPSVASLQTAVDDLRDAMTAANTGGAAQREIRDQKRVALIDLIKQEAAYVSMVANGDVAVMLEAGFDVSKIPSPIGPLPKPDKFVVTSPREGALALSLKKIQGAKYYQYEYKKVGDTKWSVFSSPKTKVVIEGLESVTVYIARVLPLGTSEERTYSNQITATVI
jgi:hypothetical protein